MKSLTIDYATLALLPAAFSVVNRMKVPQIFGPVPQDFGQP